MIVVIFVVLVVVVMVVVSSSRVVCGMVGRDASHMTLAPRTVWTSAVLAERD